MFYINTEIETPTRFDIAKFFRFTGIGFEVLDSAMLQLVSELPVSGYFTITTQAERPDLLSWDIYNSVDYWWVLLLYNGINRVKDLTIGKVISYPSLDSLASFYLNLNLMQKTGE